MTRIGSTCLPNKPVTTDRDLGFGGFPYYVLMSAIGASCSSLRFKSTPQGVLYFFIELDIAVFSARFLPVPPFQDDLDDLAGELPWLGK